MRSLKSRRLDDGMDDTFVSVALCAAAIVVAAAPRSGSPIAVDVAGRVTCYVRSDRNPTRMQNGMSFGAVQSSAGDMVKASPESVTKAAAGAVVPDDFRVSITNAPGAGAYPLSSFTWLLLYADPSDKTQARALNEFVKWALTVGQKYAPELHFARLPQSLVARELLALETIKTN